MDERISRGFSVPVIRGTSDDIFNIHNTYIITTKGIGMDEMGYVRTAPEQCVVGTVVLLIKCMKLMLTCHGRTAIFIGRH